VTRPKLHRVHNQYHSDLNQGGVNEAESKPWSYEIVEIMKLWELCRPKLTYLFKIIKR
jgi:hypothetical protein